jgi:hypothetical protein
VSVTLELTSAICDRVDEFKNVFIDSGFKTFDRLQARHGAMMSTIVDAGAADFGAWQAIRPFCYTVARDLDQPVARNFKYVLDGRRLSANAGIWALSLIDAYAAVVRERGDRLDYVRFRQLDGFAYELIGRRGGRIVRIVQDVVIERSLKGTMLYSFPSRIYVEGRIISVKKYDLLFDQLERAA